MVDMVGAAMVMVDTGTADTVMVDTDVAVAGTVDTDTAAMDMGDTDMAGTAAADIRRSAIIAPGASDADQAVAGSDAVIVAVQAVLTSPQLAAA